MGLDLLSIFKSDSEFDFFGGCPQMHRLTPNLTFSQKAHYDHSKGTGSSQYYVIIYIYISKRRKRRDRHRASFIETAVPETRRHEQGTVCAGAALTNFLQLFTAGCVGAALTNFPAAVSRGCAVAALTNFLAAVFRRLRRRSLHHF